MAEREVGAKVFVGFSVIALAAGGAFAWWQIDRTEYVNERVVTCTVTDEHAFEEDSLPTVETVQCGTLTFRYFVNPSPVLDDLEPGRTYRLRVADIRPVQYEGAIAIVGIDGEG